MVGYRIFIKLFWDLDECDRVKFLSNIFEIEDISLYSVCDRENRVLFRIYSRDIFYQFTFVFDDTGDGKAFSYVSGKRFVQYVIYPLCYDSFSYPYSSLVRIFLSHRRDVIGNLIHLLL